MIEFCQLSDYPDERILEELSDARIKLQDLRAEHSETDSINEKVIIGRKIGEVIQDIMLLGRAAIKRGLEEKVC